MSSISVSPANGTVASQPPPSLVSRALRLRPSKVDFIFGTIATALGLLSLDYPLGRDQGLFYYAAREWLLRGQVLYRDVWDHKPPVIYLVHMLAIALFGEHLWGIRLLDLVVAVPLIARATAWLASARGEPIPAGALGASWLSIAVLYYGYESFWETGQCEIWAALFAAWAIASAARARNESFGCTAAGILAALAFFTKPPMLFFAVLAAGAIVLRARARSTGRLHAALRGLVLFSAGGVLTGGALLGWFAAHGALGAMLDILVGANSVYVADERWIHNAGDLIIYTEITFSWLGPLSDACVLGVVGALFFGVARRERTLVVRYALVALLAIATYATVAVQLKFYAYHWITIAVAVGVLAAATYMDLARVAQKRASWFVPATFAGLVFGLFLVSGPALQRYVTTLLPTIRYELKQIDREEFSKSFDVPGYYPYHDAEQVGLWLRRRSSPDDTVVVRSFEPEIYAISHRYFTGRFFWTPFLIFPTRAYRRDQLIAEDAAAIERRPPRYAVVFDFVKEGLDSPSWFEQRGYRQRAKIGAFVILEHVPAGSP